MRQEQLILEYSIIIFYKDFLWDKLNYLIMFSLSLLFQRLSIVFGPFLFYVQQLILIICITIIHIKNIIFKVLRLILL